MELGDGRIVAERPLEPLADGPRGVAQGDLRERHDVAPDRRRVEQGGKAPDHPLPLEAPHPLEAGPRREADPLREGLVGYAAVPAERGEDRPVDTVEPRLELPPSGTSDLAVVRRSDRRSGPSQIGPEPRLACPGRRTRNPCGPPAPLPMPFNDYDDISDDLPAAIGNTPLIRLRRASEATGCTILGKAEFMNPGQSVKDRAALFIIEDAVQRGLLRPGGVIVEGTAGNTGIGLALVGNALGYRTVIVIPDTQSQEKKDMLRLAGAELVEVPAVPYANPNNYVKVSGRLAETLAKTEPNGAIWANQFDNRRQPPGPYRDHRARRSGSRPAARSTASSARSAPAARWPASAWR